MSHERVFLHMVRAFLRPSAFCSIYNKKEEEAVKELRGRLFADDADDAGIVLRSRGALETTMTMTMTACLAFGLQGLGGGD